MIIKVTFIVIFFMSFIYNVIALQYCSSAKTFSCPDSTTCCRGPTGWRCYPVQNGNCCKSGLNCCPQDSVCNNETDACKSPNKFLGFSSINGSGSAECFVEDNIKLQNIKTKYYEIEKQLINPTLNLNSMRFLEEEINNKFISHLKYFKTVIIDCKLDIERLLKQSGTNSVLKNLTPTLEFFIRMLATDANGNSGFKEEEIKEIMSKLPILLAL